jgi:ribosome-interacting GTPase 1
MAEISLIRKRVRAEIDAARKLSAERRQRTAAAEKAYDFFLMGIAVPVFRQIANALRSENIAVEVQTPSNGVRLASDRNRDGIEIELDTNVDPPQPMIVSTVTRGSRVTRHERPIKSNATIESITEDDVIDRVMEEIRPWLS